MMAVFGFLSNLLGNFMSSVATSLIVAPVMKGILKDPCYLPYTKANIFLLVFACGNSFATPIATPMNLIVTAAEKYTWPEFFRFAFPAQIMELVLSIGLCYALYFPALHEAVAAYSYM